MGKGISTRLKIYWMDDDVVGQSQLETYYSNEIYRVVCVQTHKIIIKIVGGT